MDSAANVKGRHIQIAGSANPSCPRDKLRLAHRFVRALTREVLSAGGNLVGYASNEPRTDDEEKLPLTFGWLVLDELSRFFDAHNSPPEGPRVVVITSTDAERTRMTRTHRDLLARLGAQGFIAMEYVKEEVFTGGNTRDKQTRWADALVTLGGGKGVMDLALKMQGKKAPVLPLDLELGAFYSDGVGSLGLLKQAKAEPEHFLPGAAELLRRKLPGLSLEVEGVDPDRVARQSLELLGAAFSAARERQPVELLFLTALPVELEALLRTLGLAQSPAQKLSSGTNCWLGELESRRTGRPFRFAIGCIGTAGNMQAAAMTAELISCFHPRLVIMVGIAAGIRGKCRLGEVVLSERVISYEPAAEVLDTQGQPGQQARPETFLLPYPIQQDAVAYVCMAEALEKRLTTALKALGVELPRGDPDFVAPGPLARLATIASGEKLLRNPEKLAGLRGSLHGRIEAGEMEAAGVATACFRASTHFLIVRGISDFGDGDKDDRFHLAASAGAAIVAVDFAREALNLNRDA